MAATSTGLVSYVDPVAITERMAIAEFLAGYTGTPASVTRPTFASSPHHPTCRTPMSRGITTYADRNPFHYLAECAQDVPLRVTGWYEWQHPRAQRMMTFEHLAGPR